MDKNIIHCVTCVYSVKREEIRGLVCKACRRFDLWSGLDDSLIKAVADEFSEDIEQYLLEERSYFDEAECK
jgi:hypothetical protein